MADKNKGGAFFAGLIIGGLVGAGITALLPSHSKEAIRIQIKKPKNRSTVNVSKVGQYAQEQVVLWHDKCKEALERGRQSAGETVVQGVDKLIDKIGREAGISLENGRTENDVIEMAAG